MRISRLLALAVMATLALAPAANAKPQDLRSPDARDAAAIVDSWQGARVHDWQDLRSPDARDASDHAQRQDLARLHAGNPRVAGLIAQEKYYSSYGKAQTHAARYAARPADDSSPWLAIGIGLGLIALVAGSVAVAVRTRRRSMRVAV